jgi:branched-chain amino acid transport system substrate-binding protein
MESSTRMRLVSLVAAMALAGAACAGSVVGGGGEAETLKIGVPLALTGPIAAQAEEMVNAYNLYLDEHDGELGGVPTDLLFEDTEADPNTVIAKTRKLIEQDEVHMIGGGALALESLAIIDVVDRANIAFVTPISSADDLTQRELKPIFARPNMTSSQPNLAFGEWVYNELGYKRIAVIAQDYAYGWESAGGFQFAFEESGGDVVQKVWVPLDATDMAPFVRQLKVDQVDAVYAMLIGAFVPRFVKTYTDFGLKEKTPLLGGPDMADEDALRAMGDEERGLIIVHEYAASLPTAQEFVNAYRDEHDSVPSYWAESTYITAQWIDETIKKVIDEEGVSAGEVPQWIRDNPEDFIDVFSSVSLDSPHGPLSLDDYHNVVTDLHIFEVVAPDEKRVLETIPQAGQFWKLTPEEFLENPVFSREFPPTN